MALQLLRSPLAGRSPSHPDQPSCMGDVYDGLRLSLTIKTVTTDGRSHFGKSLMPQRKAELFYYLTKLMPGVAESRYELCDRMLKCNRKRDGVKMRAPHAP
ncbi:hypothetical protein [Nostoc sp.]|uniref:hypothetical protein n=1 Tax=Nostoc sp. TaxID=1180 RepID=UPI002FF93E12